MVLPVSGRNSARLVAGFALHHLDMPAIVLTLGAVAPLNTCTPSYDDLHHLDASFSGGMKEPTIQREEWALLLFGDLDEIGVVGVDTEPFGVG